MKAKPEISCIKIPASRLAAWGYLDFSKDLLLESYLYQTDLTQTKGVFLITCLSKFDKSNRIFNNV